MDAKIPIPADDTERRKLLRRLREEREIRREQHVRLREESGNWIDEWAQLMADEHNGWESVKILGKQSRRGGQNWPVFRTEKDLDIIRTPSRILTSRNLYAIGLTDAICGYVVGTGMGIKAGVKNSEAYPGLEDGLQRIVDEYMIRNQFGGNDEGEMLLRDAELDEGEQPSLQDEACKRLMIDGEWINVSTYNTDGTTDERIAEPDQLTAPPAGTTCNGVAGGVDDWKFGILTAKDDSQKHLGYNIQWGETYEDAEQLGPDRVTHVRNNAWRTVKRGIPDFFGDTLDAFDLANKLRGNLGEAAAQRASIVGVRQNEAGTAAEIGTFNDGQANYDRNSFGQRQKVARYGRGRWEDLGNGTTYADGPGAGNDANHVMVLQALLRAGAVRWCGTEWLTSGDASNGNYSSSLVANSHFVLCVRKRQMPLRRAFGKLVVRALCHAIKTKGYVECEGLGGAPVRYPAYLVLKIASVIVTTPNPETHDPLAEAQRLEIECRNKANDPITWAQQQGRDPDTIEKNWQVVNEAYPELNQDLVLNMGDVNTPAESPPNTNAPMRSK